MTAARTPRTPSYCHHKPSDQGFVEIDRRQIYLGRWGLPETEEAYYRLIAEWIANGRKLPVPVEEVTVVELCAGYWAHAQTHYRRPDGTPSSELENVKRALGALKELYGTQKVGQFGPLQLLAVRQGLIDRGLTRGTVNHTVGSIRRIFKWGVAQAMIEPAVFGALQAVDGLRRGRSEAR